MFVRVIYNEIQRVVNRLAQRGVGTDLATFAKEIDDISSSWTRIYNNGDICGRAVDACEKKNIVISVIYCQPQI